MKKQLFLDGEKKNSLGNITYAVMAKQTVQEKMVYYLGYIWLIGELNI